jgi:hypothetical protein
MRAFTGIVPRSAASARSIVTNKRPGSGKQK